MAVTLSGARESGLDPRVECSLSRRNVSLRLDLAEIVVASNANMGGPTSAAAMAVARRWDTLVIPAILCGTLGYATASFIGVAVGHWLR